MSVDLPTPPFPDATAMTRVPGESEIVRSARVTAAQARDERRLLLRRHHVEAEPHARDAGNRADVPRDLLLEASRAAGSPTTVSAIVTDTEPSSSTRTSRTMSSSVTGPSQLGIDDVLERLQDRVAVWPHRGERTRLRSAKRRREPLARARGESRRRAQRASAPRGRAAPRRTADPRRARSRARTRARAAARRRCRPSAPPSASRRRRRGRRRGGRARARASP